MLKRRLKRISQLLKLIVNSDPSKRLFVVLVFLGLIISLVFHQTPVLLILTFVTWTSFCAVTFFLDALIDFINREIISAVWLLLLFGWLSSLSYLACRMLVE
jgi:hypothetical protein